MIDNYFVHFILGFPGGSVIKNLPANAGDVGLIPASGRSPGEGSSGDLPHLGTELASPGLVGGFFTT